jgi:uncharacterized protein YjbI with pentapeptide repeats
MSNSLVGGDREPERGRIPQEELDRLVEDHALWLQSDGREGRKFDMPAANLIYGGFLAADLRQANLAGACLFNANLRECDLTEANLTQANLEGASMVNVNLSRANLRGANLDKVVIPGVNFEDADLTDAHLRSSNLLSAIIYHTHMCGADLTDTNLAGGSARESALDNVNLTDAKLMIVDFSGSSLTGADFKRAVIFGAILDGTDLADADLRSALGLTEEQLAAAYGNSGTQLPEAFAGYAMTEKPSG